MNRKKGGKKAEAGFEFNHYDLHVSHYQGRLAPYALGRLLRRLEWHHEQAIVLAAKWSCDCTVQRPEWREPILKKDRRSALKEYEKELIAYKRDLLLLEKMRSTIRMEVDSQRDYGDHVADQIQEVMLCQPSCLLDQADDEFQTLRSRLEIWTRSESFDEDARELLAALRSFEVDEWAAELRCDRLQTFVRKRSTNHFARFRKSLTAAFNKLVCYFKLGWHLEAALCPRSGFLRMLPEHQPVGGEYDHVSTRANLAIGYQSFSPGSIFPPASTFNSIRRAMRAAAISDATVRTLLKPQSETLSALAMSGQDNPKPVFQFRNPPNTLIVERFASLHKFVTETIRAKEQESGDTPPVSCESLASDSASPLSSTLLSPTFSAVDNQHTSVQETGNKETNSPSRTYNESLKADYAPAAELLLELSDLAPTQKQLVAFIKSHPTIRIRRPLQKNGKERPNRMLVHLADWRNCKLEFIEWLKTRRRRGGRVASASEDDLIDADSISPSLDELSFDEVMTKKTTEIRRNRSRQ